MRAIPNVSGGRKAQGRLVRACLFLLLALVFVALQPRAAFAGVDQKFPEVRQYFPDATRFGDISGKPPAAPVYAGDKVIGYVFESVMVAPVPAYSGKPINILVAINGEGKIIGTKVLYQDEPILLVGIPVQKLYDFVASYIGRHVTDKVVVGGSSAPGSVKVDAISSATVTSMVANETIMNAALEVAVSRHLVSGELSAAGDAIAKVRTDFFRPATWQTLTGNGAIRRLDLTRQAVADAFKGQPESGLIDDPTAPPKPDEANDTFMDMDYAAVTPPTVGRNLLGDEAYASLMRQLQPGDQAIAVMANGLYSFKGVGYVRGGVFDRIHVVQDGKLFLFKDSDFYDMGRLHAAGAPDFTQRGIFILRHGKDFNPGAPWTLQLLVNRQVGPLKSVYSTFSGGYQIPADYVEQPKATVSSARTEAQPLWAQVWHQQRFRIAVLVAGLAFLTLLLTFMDWVVKRPVLLRRVRIGFLIYTVVFIGWYGLAQLSVVNILTFINSIIHGFSWSTFLIDPMQFILWVFVAACLLIVGRGVYCGWLCPFGAMQELIHYLAQKLKIPQYEPPRFIHERLWVIKYLILLGLFGMSLQSVSLAETYAEVEPFKTAVVMHFARSWGFVLYAVIWLAASAFTDKVYCRYVCPLGAGLGIGSKWHLFEWLRRRGECGHPCQICAIECEVQAIDPLGKINYSECHYCLDCQVTYVDDHKCPPLVRQRKLREGRTAGKATKRTAPVITFDADPATEKAQ